MSIHGIQIQHGMSLPELIDRYGTEAECDMALGQRRWPAGFHGPRWSGSEHYAVGDGARKLYQCRACRHRTSLTAGTLMESTKLPLGTWFLVIYLICQVKTGLSDLALMRQLSTSDRAARLIHQKVMATMAQCKSQTPLRGLVQFDDACLGGEKPGMDRTTMCLSWRPCHQRRRPPIVRQDQPDSCRQHQRDQRLGSHQPQPTARLRCAQ